MNQLAQLEKMTPAEIYQADKIDTILAKIKEEVSTFEPDLTTAVGRKEIASLAYKVAQSKTFMDSCGKKLTEEAQKQVDAINAERKKIRDTLDALKEEVRKPLTEWEQAEELRIHNHRSELNAIAVKSNAVTNSWQTMDVIAMHETLEEIKAYSERDWQEFKEEADDVISRAVERTETAIKRRSDYDEQQAELIRLREEKAQREKAEAERLEKEREQARLKAEAEARARAEAQRIEQEKLAEERRLAREKELKEEAAQAKKRAEELADKRIKEIQEKAERDKQLAIENERKRVEDEKRKAAEAEAKRQANKRHQAKINNEILTVLKAIGVQEEIAKEVITKIAQGHVPHTKITY